MIVKGNKIEFTKLSRTC